MSRIFDALRQSEKDKLPGTEGWNAFPGAPPNAPDLSQAEQTPQAAELPTPQADENPPEVSSYIAALQALNSQIDAASRPEDADFGFSSELSPEFGQPVAAAAPQRAPLAVPQRPLVPQRPPIAAAIPQPPDLPVFATDTFAGFDGLGFDGNPELPDAEPVRPQIDLSKLRVVPVSAIPSPLLVALSSERGLGAEKFRVLGTRLSNIRLGTTLGVLQVTSSVVGEGKTLTSVNLAMTLATRFDQKVLLVEGDLRKPAVCDLLGMSEHAGIGEWWNESEKPISDFLLRIGETGMCILPAGTVVHPASVLQSPRLAELIGDLAKQFDWIIIDTPPLLPMADSNLWSRIADGTLMVVRKGVVSRAALKKAVESLDNPKLVGIVLNDASDYDRVNYYDQYYTRGGEEAARKVAVR
jgi:capsular exopolysaccharide synthesis family protein